MTLRMQAMLLRFLENGEVHPVGSDAPATRLPKTGSIGCATV